MKLFLRTNSSDSVCWEPRKIKETIMCLKAIPWRNQCETTWTQSQAQTRSGQSRTLFYDNERSYQFHINFFSCCGKLHVIYYSIGWERVDWNGPSPLGASCDTSIVDVFSTGVFFLIIIIKIILSVWKEWLTGVTDALGAWFAPGWCTKRTPAKTVIKEIIIIIIIIKVSPETNFHGH